MSFRFPCPARHLSQYLKAALEYGNVPILFKQCLYGLVGLICFTHITAKAGGTEPAQFNILAIGDSLTAGYGLKPGQSFPAQLEAALKNQGIDAAVINAGVSGDTTSGGLSRLAWLIEGTVPAPDLVILEFGANDALRGIDPSITRSNIDSMLGYLTAKGLKVLLAGMMAPPNMGEDYGRKFNVIYPALAKKYRVALDPFFLKDVAGRPGLNQADGMHPNAAGVAIIVKRLTPEVIALVGADMPPEKDKMP